ncbi:hypothetical protein [Lysobacter niastensis]|uniref:Uncharacterized protein n=1 Tax=Lysobacter niastensis TaxID=380629 RepID=A0ABS0B796_9GAMM|nr:hypothetical protein [Lysobacter niastensis]MBF6024896.1 hypothetical protein [Lysobacter niastensis]
MSRDYEQAHYKAPVEVLFSAASSRLTTKGEINLGMLISLFEMGHHCAHEEYAALIAEHRDLFASGIDDFSDLYELVLNLLEQAHGPLFCEVELDEDELDEIAGARTWGYASPLSQVPSTPSGSRYTTEEVANMWAFRIRALDLGHPDQAWYDGNELPFNTWRLAGWSPKTLSVE